MMLYNVFQKNLRSMGHTLHVYALWKVINISIFFSYFHIFQKIKSIYIHAFALFNRRYGVVAMAMAVIADDFTRTQLQQRDDKLIDFEYDFDGDSA